MSSCCLAAVWVLVPFLWAVLNSIKTLEETFRLRHDHPVSAIPANTGFLATRC